MVEALAVLQGRGGTAVPHSLDHGGHGREHMVDIDSSAGQDAAEFGGRGGLSPQIQTRKHELGSSPQVMVGYRLKILDVVHTVDGTEGLEQDGGRETGPGTGPGADGAPPGVRGGGTGRRPRDKLAAHQ